MAPVVLMLAGVIVRATTKKALQRLINAGFRKASSGVAKSKANIVNATDDNIISLITRAKARSKTRGKGTTDKPKPKTQAEVKQALKRNENKVSSKKFGDRKLSDYDKVSNKTKTKVKRKVPQGLASTTLIAISTPTKINNSSNKVSEAPLTKYEKDKIRSVKTNARTSNPEGKVPSKDPGVLKIKKIVEDALKKDNAPPSSVLNKVLRPRARPKIKEAAVKKQLSAFEKAFKAARAAKKYSFPYQGKEITTRYKEETVAEHRKKFPKKK